MNFPLNISISKLAHKVCVMGLGYIGLPTAAVLATNGFQVIGVDVNSSIIDTLNNGDIHIKEPGLRTMVQGAYKLGNLVAQSDPEQADIFFICVPTPITSAKKADLGYVIAAAEAIVPFLRPNNLVVLESTVPPGTTTNVVVPVLRRSGLTVSNGAGPTDLFVAYCPERVLPGNIIKEIIANNRIIGGVTPEAAEQAKAIYKRFVEGDLYLTDATTAELVKLSENTFRDVNIALANELADICEELGVDVWEVIQLANRHPRVNLHSPGPGVGGHCISVDPWFLIEAASEIARLIKLSREINDERPLVVVDKIKEMTKIIPDPKVVILGVAYKGNVDDVRESPAIHVIRALEKAGYRLGIVDPHVRSFPWELSGVEEAFSGADLVVLLTDHEKFRDLLPEKLGCLMRKRQLLDTRHFLDHKSWRESGFLVVQLGSGRE